MIIIRKLRLILQINKIIFQKKNNNYKLAKVNNKTLIKIISNKE